MDGLITQYKLIASVFKIERLIIVTPDQSEESRKIIDGFKKAGIKGVWRPLKRDR